MVGGQVVRVTVVRHALAVDKRSWQRPDRDRPLNPAGERDAVALADQLAAFPIRRLVSSSARRCLQSLAPLADRMALPIERHDDLHKDVHPDAFLALIFDAASDDAVLCTHGEVMRPLLRQIRRGGVEITGDPGIQRKLLAKGSAWQLTISAAGKVEQLHHVVPSR